MRARLAEIRRVPAKKAATAQRRFRLDEFEILQRPLVAAENALRA